MIYLFHGSNERAARQQINRLIKKYKKSTGSDFGLYRFDEEADSDAVSQALQTTPMFAPASLVILEHPGRSRQLTDALQPVLDNLPEKTVLAIYDPGIDKRSTWFRKLKQVATTKEFSRREPAQRQQWLHWLVQDKGGEISEAAADLLLLYVDDEWRLENEVDKLIHVADIIKEEHIRQLVQPSPQQTVFALLDALAEGRIDAALAHVRDLQAQKVSELEMLAMIGWQLRSWLVVASAGDKPDRDIAAEHKMNPFVIKKARSVTRKIGLQELEAAHRCIIEADYAMKTTGHQPDILLDELIVSLGDRLQPVSG